MVSSVIIFAASNLDRLTLGKIAPLALVGIYGLARTMADIPALMARRLGYQIIFPMLADARSRGDEVMVASVSPARMKLVLLAAAVIGLGVGSADWAVSILYDSRYVEAGWMLSLLLFGSWFSILSNFNEALLMGAGRPAYESGANVIRFAVLAGGLWFGYVWAGVAGAILAIVAAELGRYVFVAYGQRRERLSFLRQDALATGALLLVVCVWVGGRLALGLGDPWRMMLEGLK
jgi:O-antigen/teichoic acid export membrane protein